MLYVVHKGKIPGIYSTWNQCKEQVDRFDGAIFKKCSNIEDATLFLSNGFSRPPRHVQVDEKNKLKIEEALDKDAIIIYTDGSCIRMKTNLCKAGYGIYIPHKHIKVARPLIDDKITNNRAELTAILQSIEYLDEEEKKKKICIFTDSQYSMYLFNGTGERYEKNNFTQDGKTVPNIDLIQQLLHLKRTYSIVLLKIRAHTDKKDEHSIGNKIADQLANEGAMEPSYVKPVFQSYLFKDTIEKDTIEQDTIEKEIDTEKKTEKYVCKKKSSNKLIHSNIQMNELFDFEEKESSKAIVFHKNMNLTNWFHKNK